MELVVMAFLPFVTMVGVIPNLIDKSWSTAYTQWSLLIVQKQTILFNFWLDASSIDDSGCTLISQKTCSQSLGMFSTCDLSKVKATVPINELS